MAVARSDKVANRNADVAIYQRIIAQSVVRERNNPSRGMHIAVAKYHIDDALAAARSNNLTSDELKAAALMGIERLIDDHTYSYVQMKAISDHVIEAYGLNDYDLRRLIFTAVERQ